VSHENVYNKLIENQLADLGEPPEPINKNGDCHWIIVNSLKWAR